MIGIFGAAVASVGIPAGLAIRWIRITRRRKRLMQKALPPEWIEIAQRNAAIYRVLPDEFKPQLHGHMQNFLFEKHFEGCGGIDLTEEMKVTVAAQACILLLNRKCTYFPKCDSILIYPSAYIAEKASMMGNVRIEETDVRLGESWVRGVVVLAWDRVKQETPDAAGGRNVVLHEFAHQLDQEDGQSDGAPILEHREDYASWSRVFSRDYEALRQSVIHHIKNVIDAYGATNPAEFFAVATEVFFERAKEMKKHHPELYEELKKYYRLDPAEWNSA